MFEIEISLLDKDNNFLEIQKESVLGVKEEFNFEPMTKLAEGSYQLICKYKGIQSIIFNQTLLPFKVKNASKQDEVYITPGKMEFQIGNSNL